MNINTKILLLFLLLLFSFLISFYQISDFDIWFHLETGEYILENRSIPAADPFSFTAQEEQWQIHDWLTAVIYYSIFCLFSFNGLIILNSLILAFTFLIIYKTALLYRPQKTENPFYYYLAFIITICAVLIARCRFVIRPFIFSYLFISIFLYIIRLYKVKGKRLLWVLPILMLIWSNIHYGCVLGIAILVIQVLGELLKWMGLRYFNCGPKALLPAKKLQNIFFITVFTILASLVNPYGWRFFLYGLKLQNILVNFPIAEHMGTVLRWYPLFTVNIILLGIVLLLTIKRIDFSEFLLILIFLYISLSNVRFIALFAIIASPITAKHLYLSLERFITITSKKTKKIINILLLIALTITFFTVMYNEKHFAFGLGIKKGAFPEKAVRFLKENNIRGNMFNPYHYGGYLNWALFPRNRVFVDGRLVFYGSDTLQKYLEIVKLHPLWNKLLSQTNVDLVIFNEAPFLDGLRKSSGWSLVYWDDIVSIYLRNIPKNKELISRYQYKYINPNDRNLDYLNGKERIQINKAIYDIKGKLSFDPECALAHHFLALCYKMKSRPGLQLEEYKKAFHINPRSPIVSKNLGVCYENMGKTKEAVKYYKKALRLNPYMDDAYVNLGGIYHRHGQLKRAYRYYKKGLRYNYWNYDAHNNLGSIYLSWNKLEDADMEFRNAIGIDQTTPDAWYNIACLNGLNGNLAGFFYYFKKALSVAKDKTKYIDMAKREHCFDKIRTKKIYKRLIDLRPLKNH